jgi:hypothetical protein
MISKDRIDNFFCTKTLTGSNKVDIDLLSIVFHIDNILTSTLLKAFSSIPSKRILLRIYMADWYIPV